jgi:hypothetical protein
MLNRFLNSRIIIEIEVRAAIAIFAMLLIVGVFVAAFFEM